MQEIECKTDFVQKKKDWKPNTDRVKFGQKKRWQCKNFNAIPNLEKEGHILWFLFFENNKSTNQKKQK